MRYINTIYFVVLILFCTTPYSSNAGNIGDLKIKFPLGLVNFDDDTEVEVEGKNLNSTYSVTGIKIEYKIKDLSLGSYVYENEYETDDLKANKDFDIKLGALPWGSLSIGKSYGLSLEFKADFDEDPSNNTVTQNFEVKSNYLDRQLIIESWQNYIEKKYNLETLRYSSGFLGDFVLPMGTEIRYDDYGSQPFMTDKDYYIGFLDFDTYSKFSHNSRLYLIDAKSGDISESSINSRPYFWGNYYPSYVQESTDLVFGEGYKQVPINEDDFMFEISDPVSTGDSVCCFLISGKPGNEREKNAFEKDIREIEKEFTLEKRGPKLPVNRVEKIFDDLEGLYNKIEALNNKYNKIYIYYTGHADSLGQLNFKENVISYADILRDLKAQGVKEVCAIFDCCFAGNAIEQYKEDEDLKDLAVTIISSSNKNSVSKVNHFSEIKGGKEVPSGMSSFSKVFIECLGNTAADKNKDSKISLVEAYEWVKTQNPVIIINGKDTIRISIQDPQIHTTERAAVNSSNQKISFDDDDLKISFNSGMGSDMLNVKILRGMNVFDGSFSSDVYSASKSRMWDIEFENGTFTGFQADMEFKFNPLWDRIENGMGVRGVIVRETESDTWKPHYPVVYDEINETFKVSAIIKFSQWALGRVAPASSVESESNIYISESSPNPFNNNFTIRFNVRQDADLRIDLIDIFGNRIKEISSMHYSAGNYSMLIDGSEIPSGTYFLKLSSAFGSELIKIIKSE